MPNHDIVVIGASAGGLEALKQLVYAIPEDFPGSIFVVLHTAAHSPSMLDSILDQAGKLKAFFPDDGTKIAQGNIYVAEPDRHLLIEDSQVRTVRGPKENRFRPAIDPLFRSAAWAYGPRVVGVVLTGMLDDGAEGLWAIKTTGGVTIVQDPSEAMFADMPMNALKNFEVDYVLPLADIAPRLVKLAQTPIRTKSKAKTKVPNKIKTETEAAMNRKSIRDMEQMGMPSVFTCPQCGGTMWELRDGELVRYRCHVGHAFSVDSLLAEQSEAVEDALYSALKTIEEKAELHRQMAQKFTAKNSRERSSLEKKAAEQDRNAAVLRQILSTRNI